MTPASSGWRRAKPALPSSTAAAPRSRRRRPRPRANAAARARAPGREPCPGSWRSSGRAARLAGGAIRAGECPARRAAGAGEAAAARARAREARLTPPRPAAEGAGDQRPARGDRATRKEASMDRLLKAKTRHALMCRLTLRAEAV